MQPRDFTPSRSQESAPGVAEDTSPRDIGPLDSQLPRPAFDHLASLAARLLRTPTAFVTLATSDGRPALLGSCGVSRQTTGTGDDGPVCAACEQVTRYGVPITTANSRADSRSGDDPNPLANGTGAHHCVPLTSESGAVIGTLCAADSVPRSWSEYELGTFDALAAQVGREIELWTAAVASERLHATLRRQMARSEELFRLAPAFICIVHGADHVFEFANDRFLELIGRQEVVGRPAGKIVPELVSQGFIKLLDRVRATGEAYVGNRRSVVIQRAFGTAPEERYVSFVLQPIAEDDGAEGGVFALGVDVTEEFRAHEQLARRDALLLETQRIAQVGSWEYDVSLHSVTWTDEMYRLHGLSPDAGPDGPSDYRAHVHPDDRALVDSVVDRARATAQPFAMDYRIVRPDGTVRSVHGRGRVETDASGRTIRMLGSCQDVTDRLETLSALRASEERYRLVQLATRDVIWDWDMATNRLTLSDASFAALGHTRPAPEDTMAWWMERLHPEEKDRVVDSLREVLEQGGSSWTCEYRFRHGNGGYAQLMTRAHVMRDESGNAVRMIGASEDRTEQCALEAQLREAQRMESVGRLAGGIAHDFNNLLTVISANTMFARSEVDPEGQAAHDLDQIDQASRRAADLTRQLLAFGRKQILRPRRVDVNQLVGGMREMMRRTIGEDVHIETVLTPAPWPARADPGQIDQVLLNLVINARDAMPDGGTIRITTANVEIDEGTSRSHGDLASGCYVSIAVDDTGVGIASSLLPHIFEPFVTTKPPGEGTGLGLAMVYGIIKQSGGHVDARSTLGAGTTITVLLPCDENAGPATAVPVEPTHRAAGGRETILLVEDDAAVRASLHRVLTHNGYSVLQAANGEEALRVWLAHNRPEGDPTTAASDVPDGREKTSGSIDLVLTDLVMPVLGGRLLVERLRAVQPDSRIVIMSGYTADTGEVQAVLMGDKHSAFLQKPIRPDELLHTVRSVIEGRPVGPG